jgi:ABC-2 type transport system ATP-binding protein
MTDVAIRVAGLRKTYQGQAAVDGIDLDVRRGEVFSLLGPNGAGKSTTVEILEGYRSRDSGELSVLGHDPAHATAEWKSRIGIVLQRVDDLAQSSELTVREWVGATAAYFPDPLAPDEAIELVGLAEKRDARASSLSGGQRRRLDVGLALVGSPELLFLDEPTTGFDAAARRAAWDLVDGLRRRGTTIVLTTHAMDEAERLADRIVVVVGGTVAAEGPPMTIGGRDRRGAEIRFTLPAGTSADELPLPAEADGRAVVVRSVSPLADLRALAGWALPRGVDLPDLEVRRPALEDVYLALASAGRSERED